MHWVTVYIKGRTGFEEAVLARLGNKWLNGNVEMSHRLVMFWLRDSTSLREFKQAIGSRIIFKFRLQFSTNLEEFAQAENDRIMEGERDVLEEEFLQ